MCKQPKEFFNILKEHEDKVYFNLQSQRYRLSALSIQTGEDAQIREDLLHAFVCS